MSDSNDSTVNNSTVTGEKQERPESDKSATEKAIDLLKRKMAAGEDFVNKPLSRKQAEIFGKEVGGKHGVIYAARAKIATEIQNKLTDSAGKNIDAEIDVDDLLAGAKEVSGGQAGHDAGGGQSLITEQPKEKKPKVPIDPAMLKTISDAILGSIFETYKDAGHEIPAEQQKALKTTYNTTYEAYGLSIPKWALIPLCVAVTIVILGLPVRKEIHEGIIEIRDMMAGKDSKEDLK